MIPWYSWLLAVLILIALVVLILKSNEDKDKKEQQKAKKFIRSLPTDNWYRVGDALTRSETKGKGYSLAMNKDGKLRKNDIAQYGRDHYPGSLLAYMVDTMDDSTFLDSFNDFMSKKGPDEESLRNCAVLHLRLGDKLTRNKAGSDIKYNLPEVEVLNQMIFPFLKQNEITELKIICGLGVPNKGEKWFDPTVEYLTKVLSEAKKQNVKTELVNGAADEDLALLSKAPFVILTSGGYAMPSVAYRNKNFKTYVLINNPQKAEFFQRYMQDSKGKVVNLTA